MSNTLSSVASSFNRIVSKVFFFGDFSRLEHEIVCRGFSITRTRVPTPSHSKVENVILWQPAAEESQFIAIIYSSVGDFVSSSMGSDKVAESLTVATKPDNDSISTTSTPSPTYFSQSCSATHSTKNQGEIGLYLPPLLYLIL